MNPSRVTCLIASFLGLLNAACTTTPRPMITIGAESAAENAPPSVRASVVPNQFPVTEIILEFGMRPTTGHAQSILYDSTPNSFNLLRTLSATLPAIAPINVSFRLDPRDRFRTGTVVDYQFRVTHQTESGSWRYFWSPRKTFVIGPPVLTPPQPPDVVTPTRPNLLPSPGDLSILTRALGDVISTPAGGMFQVRDAFCVNLADGAEAEVNVSALRWGVSGVNIDAVTAGFTVQLLNVSDPSTPIVLDTLEVPNGFLANTPVVFRENYPGRSATIRVIRNPRFEPASSTTQTFVGCFTRPGVNQLLDPATMLIRVDPENAIDEGEGENDNDLRF